MLPALRDLPKPILATLFLGTVFLAGGCTPAASAPTADASSTGIGANASNPHGTDKSSVFDQDWAEAEALEGEQKFQAATEKVTSILAEARDRNDAPNWTRALVELTKLETALHGYETAVRKFRTEAWPDDELSRAVLELYYAQSLVTYVQMYSWEIRQRERVVSSEEIDLRSWTADQIVAEADRAFERVWRRRVELGDVEPGALSRYVAANNYPAGIRDTMRDAVTYLWVELLGDSSLWSAAESNEVYRLDLDGLLVGDRPLVDAEHPIRRLAAYLSDLEEWHRENGRREAAFEARLTRLRQLSGSFTKKDDEAKVRANLRGKLDDLGSDKPWWSVGMAFLAELIRDDQDPWAVVQARRTAMEGRDAHPESIGGRRCRHIVAAIEAPSSSIASMTTDGPGRRSIEVRHKNLMELHFRAYPVDLLEVIRNSKDYNLLPQYREVEKMIKDRPPIAAWSVQLPETPDYREHRTFVTPPFEGPGTYLVVGSRRASFGKKNNDIQALYLTISDLVLLAEQLPGHLEVGVRSGRTGKAVENAEVLLFRYDYQRGHRTVETEATEATGQVTFRRDADGNQYFLLARKGEHMTLAPQNRYFQPEVAARSFVRSLVYTDRSAYRPGHDVQWKIVSYEGSTDPDHELRVVPGHGATVTLRDANREVVAESSVETNEYGSASGSFRIPAGRLLGAWSIQVSSGGGANVRVEEYKRPTFSVELEDPAEALRLNRSARIDGRADYYFGLPLVEAAVAWRVEREPVFPLWWSWYYPVAGAGVETIASGTSVLDAEGSFGFEFLPQADKREAKSGASYRFRVEVDVTDAGGETRSASRSFRLGFVAVEAELTSERHFATEGDSLRVSVRRQDLNGVARPGQAIWRLVRLTQPKTTPLPSELPEPTPVAGLTGGEKEPFRTPGDGLRPRWQPSIPLERILGLWDDGPDVAEGRLTHAEDGLAELELGRLEGGAYRLRYTTSDEFGSEYQTSKDFLVGAPRATTLNLPAVLLPEKTAVAVGEVARILVHSGLPNQEIVLELFRKGKRFRRETLTSGSGLQILELPITDKERGGVGLRLTAVRDHQLVSSTHSIFVPWDEKKLDVSFSTFRDLLRPGTRERWTVRVRGAEEELVTGAAELLAYMYDRSLDVFAPHLPPDPLSLFPSWRSPGALTATLGVNHPVWRDGQTPGLPGYPALVGDRLINLSGYGIGGLGNRRYRMAGAAKSAAAPMAMDAARELRSELSVVEEAEQDANLPASAPARATGQDEVELRSDFSETALWEPHLLLDDEGSVSFEFEVPDSVTEWNVWVHAVTTDLRAGRAERQVKTVKELLVRPYLPRFLREGDAAELRVVVQNAGEESLSGTLEFEILDPGTGEDLRELFSVAPEHWRSSFAVDPAGSWTATVPITTPSKVGDVHFRVVGATGDFSDGELRPLPILPGRMHLAQSRFVTLRDRDRKTLHFEDLAADDDPTRIDQRLVVTLDTQLFYSVLSALPYLVNYPYECTEQTLNRFLSTGILSSVFDEYPAVRKMAREFAERETQFESWSADDPNRKMAREETPWLATSRGGDVAAKDLVNVLVPKIADSQRKAALAKLRKAQTAVGGFPWFPGGPPSPYMTLYLLNGFSRAIEFDVEVPKPMIRKAWAYMHRHYLDELVEHAIEADCCWEFVTFLNYVLSSYPDESWTGGVFTADERETMLAFSFDHWKAHSPLSKAQLALTLERASRSKDAKLVFDSVMDSARTTEELGTYWAREERSWLWYNDTIETHAFALRSLAELNPEDPRRDGLVQWLLLNKKLNHWKSTRATAEVIYSLVHYLEQEGTLAVREVIDVEIGDRTRRFVFEPDEYTGKNNQVVVEGEEIDPSTDSTVVVEKETPGFAFASATWHFSTEKLPAEARGDFFAVERRTFRRVHAADGWRLEPLADGTPIAVGDQLEVQLSIRAKHAAEYVHLRDPRPSGFEPEGTTSSYKWDLGLVRYEEVRDSGMNFFFERLPVGEYTLKHRLRAAIAGTFQSAPATLQSMYAPEFTAYSAGERISIEP